VEKKASEAIGPSFSAAIMVDRESEQAHDFGSARR